MNFEVNPTGNATPIEQVRRNNGGAVNVNEPTFSEAVDDLNSNTNEVAISPEAQDKVDAKVAAIRATRADNNNAAIAEMQALKEVTIAEEPVTEEVPTNTLLKHKSGQLYADVLAREGYTTVDGKPFTETQIKEIRKKIQDDNNVMQNGRAVVPD